MSILFAARHFSTATIRLPEIFPHRHFSAQLRSALRRFNENVYFTLSGISPHPHAVFRFSSKRPSCTYFLAEDDSS